MYARQITSEDTYTLQEARKIIECEKREKRKNIIYFTKQKLIGLGMIAVGIVAPMILDNDITVSIFTVPVGLSVLLTREKVMY